MVRLDHRGEVGSPKGVNVGVVGPRGSAVPASVTGSRRRRAAAAAGSPRPCHTSREAAVCARILLVITGKGPGQALSCGPAIFSRRLYTTMAMPCDGCASTGKQWPLSWPARRRRYYCPQQRGRAHCSGERQRRPFLGCGIPGPSRGPLSLSLSPTRPLPGALGAAYDNLSRLRLLTRPLSLCALPVYSTFSAFPLPPSSSSSPPSLNHGH